MPTGRLSIARGEPDAAPAAPRPERPVAVLVPPSTAAPDPFRVEHRLAALERLTRLVEQGALSADEFAAEKALVLRLPADELVLSEPAPRRGPSLAGRMLRWHFLPAGLAGGLALAWWVQPHETMRIADQLLRALGA